LRTKSLPGPYVRRADIAGAASGFFAALGLPEIRARRAKLAGLGYGARSDFELNFGSYLPSFAPDPDSASLTG